MYNTGTILSHTIAFPSKNDFKRSQVIDIRYLEPNVTNISFAFFFFFFFFFFYRSFRCIYIIFFIFFYLFFFFLFFCTLLLATIDRSHLINTVHSGSRSLEIGEQNTWDKGWIEISNTELHKWSRVNVEMSINLLPFGFVMSSHMSPRKNEIIRPEFFFPLFYFVVGFMYSDCNNRGIIGSRLFFEELK